MNKAIYHLDRKGILAGKDVLDELDVFAVAKEKNLQVALKRMIFKKRSTGKVCQWH